MGKACQLSGVEQQTRCFVRIKGPQDRNLINQAQGNQRALQRACYEEIRLKYGLPAQMACNVPRQVAATYKGLWTKLKQNFAHRKAGHTKKRYKGLDKPPKYVSPTVTYNFGYDYSFKSGQQISVLTLQGRVVLSYQGYHRHVALIQQGATIGAARLWYDKPHKQFYVLVYFPAP